MAPFEYEPYAILGVPESATLREIKQAYRRMARVHHPDHGGDPAEFRRITDAHAYLERNHESLVEARRRAAEQRLEEQRRAAEQRLEERRLFAEWAASRRADDERARRERESSRIRFEAEMERIRQAQLEARRAERQRVKPYRDAVAALDPEERALHDRGVPIRVARRLTRQTLRAMGLTLLGCAVLAVAAFGYLVVVGVPGATFVQLAIGVGELAAVGTGVCVVLASVGGGVVTWLQTRWWVRRRLTPDELCEDFLATDGRY